MTTGGGGGGDDRGGGDGDDKLDETDVADHLHGLRAALRAMPDEEPPERGLAELLAAARARVQTAAPVAREPVGMWQRVNAWLAVGGRRPAVYAFAMVVVVAGGMVVVTQGKDERGDAARPETATATATSVKTETAPATGAAAETAAAAAPETAAETAPVTAAVAGTAAVAAPSSTTSAAAMPDAVRGAAEPVRLAVREPAKMAAPKANMHASFAAPAPAARPVDSIASAGDDLAAAPLAASSRSATLVGQWMQQCRKAAASSDCDGVRKLAARIAEADPAFYREHVTKDATLAHCLTQAPSAATLAE